MKNPYIFLIAALLIFADKMFPLLIQYLLTLQTMPGAAL